MIKAYAIGNYFLLEIPGKVEPLQDGKSNVRITLLDDASKLYRIESPQLGDREIQLADLVDQGGTAYTLATWQNFYYANSAFSAAPSSNGALKVVGFWDANTNTPDLSSLVLASGDAYQVSVPGSTNLNGQSNWATLDLAVYNDSLVGKWFKIDNTDDVISVNGKTGAVIVTKTDVGLDQVDNTSDANKPISNATQTALNSKLESVSTAGPISGDGKVGTPVKLDWRPPEVSMASLTATAGVQVFDAPAGGNAYTTPENEGFRMDLPLTLHGVQYDGSTVDIFIEYNLFSAPGAGDQVEFNVAYMMGRSGVDNYNGPGVAGTPQNFAVGTINPNEQTRQKIGEFTGNAGDTHVQLTINRSNLAPPVDYSGDFDIYALILEKQ